jgi:hypothetical protein
MATNVARPQPTTPPAGTPNAGTPKHSATDSGSFRAYDGSTIPW